LAFGKVYIYASIAIMLVRAPLLSRCKVNDLKD
jgi:hypothetical protein